MWKLGNLIFLLLCQSHILTLQVNLHEGFGRSFRSVRYTKEIRIKQGRLRGVVVRPPTFQELQYVDTFLGIPYAEPPVGLLRFSPPQSPKTWRPLKTFNKFAPVCPQVLPNFEQVKSARFEYLQQILPFLENQNEDCLYLNIYAPHQAEGKRRTKKHPVIVFIHGESYEWNSGNAYDGTILAAHGNVVFVTINFRLGIIGFLRPGIKDDTPSNFGLLDQIAALVWIKDNIEEFGGDPSLVTLMGHGTGAIFANLLLISPIANKQDLFKRAILMSGSALNPDSIAKAPLQITKQVAHALNCPTTTDEELAACLRNKDVSQLLGVKIHKPKYVPAFATLIDTAVMPKNPKQLMENSETFARYDLLYGVTELERFHLLPLVSLIHGLLDDQRDMILRDHIKATHEIEAETILSKVLEHYEDYAYSFDDNYEKRNRDMVLEVVSDSSTLAPLILTASLHSSMNANSYMYVFTHAKMMEDYTDERFKRSVNGEELPYIFGVPLNKEKQKVSNEYDKKEMILSEAVMNYWCNFAETGNPNEPRRIGSLTDGSHITGGPNDWKGYEAYWSQYDTEYQFFFNLTVPPQTGSFYRYLNMEFWNDKVPNLFKMPSSDVSVGPTSFSSSRGPRPAILDIADGLERRFDNNTNMNSLKNVIPPGMTRESAMNLNKSKNNLQSNVTVSDQRSHNISDFNFTSDLYRNLKSTSAMSMVIGLGIIFLIINLTACSYFYVKRRKLESDQVHPLQRFSYKENSDKRSRVESSAKRLEIGYKSASKPDINDVLKNDKAYDNNSNFGRQTKPSRNDSNSTIDTHIKVKEWIQQEIVQKCSPRFLRKHRETLQKEHRDNLKQLSKEKVAQKNAPIEDAIYEDSPTIVVRAGKSALPKVSVGIDATPATRTNSILNQIPIEMTKEANKIAEEESSEYLQILMPERNRDTQVVIEHHHSKSDPLPMDNMCRIIKLEPACSRMYESDSGSSCSLYAKVAPKTKSKMPSLSRMAEVQNDQTDQNIYEKVAAPTFITFGGTNNLDVNVTSQDPVEEPQRVVTHEDALKTIKRRNYPKVLPDLEKRRSLPVKPCTKMSYKQDTLKCEPVSEPATNRLFSHRSDVKDDSLTSVTNLHVGPLLKRPEKSDSKTIKTGFNQNSSIDELKDSTNSKISAPQPLSRSLNTFSLISRDGTSVKSASTDTLNQNYENVADIDTNILSRSLDVQNLRDHLRTVTFEQNLQPSTDSVHSAENAYSEPFKIVIAPKISTNAMGSENNPQAASNIELQRVLPSSMSATLPKQMRHAIVNDNFADVVKQPKIIIKPTTMSLQRNRRRNIPKVSAIPAPEKQQFNREQI